MRRFAPLLAPLGAAGFTLAWAVLGAVSPGYRLFDLVIDPYSAVAQPISGLGLGVTGPYMNTAFVLGGTLVLVGMLTAIRTLSTSRTATVGLALVSMAGVGMIVDGLFTLESVLLHLVGFVLAIPIPAAGFALLAVSLRREDRASSIALGLGAAATLALFVLFMVTFDPYSAGDNTGISGLLQRLLVSVALVTVSAIAVRATRPRAVVDAP